ncbi:uncharacterized protein METZ01_LOCUS82453 [marine metagenome]|uniref:AB hydrolase-1 domain-containing protein n=1 Tax=marine metagenome TaxID=408172 RepID=A0A381UN77_9ZZZZ
MGFLCISIALDLIGMSDSDKLDATGPDSYRFIHHRHYLNGFLDALELGDHVTFVIHDWGSALGFDWANRNRDRIAGIAYMEAIVRPVTWEEWPEAATPIFQAFRSPAGEEMVIEKTFTLKPYYLYPFFENYQTMRWLNIDAHLETLNTVAQP